MRRDHLLRLAAIALLLTLPTFVPLAQADDQLCVRHGICSSCAPSEGDRLCTFKVCEGIITGPMTCGGCFDACVPFP